MRQQNYHYDITLPVPGQQVFESLTNRIQEWWSTDFEGEAHHLNNIFTIHFNESFKTLLVETLVPNKKVIWRCLECYLDIPGNTKKEEWTGTSIIWELEEIAGTTLLHLTHVGLTPSFQCYDICVTGWETYGETSLTRLVTTGEGVPFKAKTDAT